MKKKVLIALLLVLALSAATLMSCEVTVASIKLDEDSFATEYYVGDTVDFSTATLKVTYSNERTQDVQLKADMLSAPIDTKEAGTKTYTITYEGQTTEVTITVKNPTVTAAPNTINCYVGDAIDLSTVSLTVTKGSKVSSVTLTQEMLGSQAIDTSVVGSKVYTINYSGVEVNLTVNVQAPTLELSNNIKKSYLVGEQLDLTGATVTLKRPGREDEVVTLTAAMLDKAIAPLTKGTTTYTVSCKGGTATLEVTAYQIASISIKDTNATVNVLEGMEMPYSSVVIVRHYEDTEYTDEITATEQMFNESVDTTKLGETTYTITHLEKTATLKVNVTAAEVESIAVKAGTLKTTYYLTEEVSLTGAMLVVNFVNSSLDAIEVNITANMFNKTIDLSTVGTQEYTITLREKTTKVNITVKDIQIVVDNFQTDVNYHASHSLSGATVKVVAADDVTHVIREVPVVASMVSGTIGVNVNETKDYNVTITYTNGDVVRTVEQAVKVHAMSLALGSDFKVVYSTGENAVYTGSLVVTYDGSAPTNINITRAMLDKDIDTTWEGVYAYTLTYLGVELEFDITVNIAKDESFTIASFELPLYYQNYEQRINDVENETNKDSVFKNKSAVYEVGNANKLIVPVIATALVGDTSQVVSSAIHVVFKVEVSETGAEGSYTELTGDDLAAFVSIEANTLQFKQDTGDRYVRLTVSVNPNAHLIGTGVQGKVMKFKIVDNGYNVYDQMGLAVATDMLRSDVWGEVLGLANGSPTSDVVTLRADNKPLYEYIGQVDWLIIHGSIELNPDLMPSAFFWNGTEDNYQAALDGARHADESLNMPAQLLGSLVDGLGNTNGDLLQFTDCYTRNANNNKSFYQSDRVNISGNYSAITLKAQGDKPITLGNQTAYRRFVTVVDRWDKNANAPFSGYHLFKLVEPTNEGDPSHTYTIKNLAMTGNASRTESHKPGGIAMINVYGKKIELLNVIGNAFSTNISHDNYNSGSQQETRFVMQDCKIFDTRSTIAYTWRGKIEIINSEIHDAGGPLFALNDGNGREQGLSDDQVLNAPSITVDAASKLESYAMGTEAWFADLGKIPGTELSAATAIFSNLKKLDAGLQQVAGKSMFIKRDNNDYASLLTVITCEMGQVFQSSSDMPDYYFVHGNYTINNAPDGEGNITVKDSFSMSNMRDLKIGDTPLYTTGTVVFKSGNNYACLFQHEQLEPTGTLVSPEMMAKIMGISGYYKSEAYYSDLQTWAAAWHTTSTDTLCVWLQAQPGARCPYLGIVFGNFNPVPSDQG